MTRDRLLLLLPSATYRAAAFIQAAHRLGVELTVASDCSSALEPRQPSLLLTLDFLNPARAATDVRAFSREHEISAVFGVDDDTAVAAASIAAALGLRHDPVEAARAARDKHRQRVLMAAAGVPVPRFSLHDLTEEAATLATAAHYPCVLKPVSLSASRGVIRANSPDEFVRAQARLAAILRLPDVAERGPDAQRFLVESFVPGPEVALEGLLVDGRLYVLALFDKPNPLDGPFFEETIYVTPSRLTPDAQRAIASCAERAALALGLTRGPLHAELRFNERGPWLVELAARPIGGKCGQTLRFGADGSISLEELLLAHALGRVPPIPEREAPAAGVLMIPTPRAGVLRDVAGVEHARRTSGVTDVIITAHRGQRLEPLPEGSRYLGFVFARGRGAADVEQSLRAAQSALEVLVD